MPTKPSNKIVKNPTNKKLPTKQLNKNKQLSVEGTYINHNISTRVPIQLNMLERSTWESAFSTRSQHNLSSILFFYFLLFLFLADIHPQMIPSFNWL